MFSITDVDLEAWKAFFACVFGCTVIVSPLVFMHFRREQTYEWELEKRKIELEFQEKMLEQPTAHLKFEDKDAHPST